MAKKVEIKTKRNKKSVVQFLNSIKDSEKKKDAKKINEMIKSATGEKPEMWGTSIVGYGTYTYTYTSGRTGDWMMTGFSPRAQTFSLYIMPGYNFPKYKTLLKKLGPHKLGRSCLYIKRLSDIHEPTLKKIVKEGYKDMEKKKKERKRVS